MGAAYCLGKAMAYMDAFVSWQMMDFKAGLNIAAAREQNDWVWQRMRRQYAYTPAKVTPRARTQKEDFVVPEMFVVHKMFVVPKMFVVCAKV